MNLQGNSYVRIKAHPLSDTLMHKQLQMPSRFPFIMRLTSYCFNPAIVNSNYTVIIQRLTKAKRLSKVDLLIYSAPPKVESQQSASAGNLITVPEISQEECGFYKIRQLLS